MATEKEYTLGYIKKEKEALKENIADLINDFAKKIPESEIIISATTKHVNFVDGNTAYLGCDIDIEIKI